MYAQLSGRQDMLVAVIKKEKPVGSRTNRADHVAEHRRIRFHQP
jgi:hypothetical protein